MHRRLRAPCGALALIAGTTALNDTGCDELEAPCTVSESILVSTVAEARGSIAPEFLRTKAGLAALFYESEPLAPTPADAGALGQTAAAVLPSAVHVVVLDDRALAEQARERFPVPSRLAGRRGSTGSVGVAWSRGRALFYWVESTTTTADDGRVATSAKLVLQSVDAAGVEGPSIEPVDARCDECVLQADAVDVEGVRLVVFTISSPVGTLPGLGAVSVPPRSAAFALGPANEILPRTLPDALDGTPLVPRFDVIDGVLTLVGRVVIPVDTALGLAGPVLTLPIATPHVRTVNVNLDIGGDSFVADFGISGSFDGVGSTSGAPSADLLVQRFRDGRVSAPVARIGGVGPVRAIARSGDRLMVLHGDTPRYLSLAEISGDPSVAPKKIGGDFILDHDAAQAVRVLGLPARAFRVVTLADGRVLRREVTCER